MLALDEAAMAAVRARQAELITPPGSLGRLEDLAVWLAGVTGSARPALHARVVVAAADHGVAAQGVGACPRAETAQLLRTFASGRGAVSALAGAAGAELVLVDAGVAGASDGIDCVRVGLRPSRDLSVQAALSAGEVALAVDAGRDLAARAARDGITVLAGGAIGIANTTPATCLAALLTGRDVGDLVGPGTGRDEAAVVHERAVCRRALELHADAGRGPLHALRRVGGGEIAVLCGLALGAGEHGLGYVCDGLTATAAAAIAAGVEPGLRPRLLAGHRSPAPAHDALLDHLGLEPVLDLGLRLGEGSGATAALAVLRLALAAHDGMATFAESGVGGAA